MSLFCKFALVQEFVELVLAHKGKDRIVTQIARAERLNRSFGQVTVPGAQYHLRFERVDQLLFSLFFEATGITLDADYEAIGSHTSFAHRSFQPLSDG
jgi:hypothetical protein